MSTITIYEAISINRDKFRKPSQKKALQQAISSLPEDQQKVLRLHYEMHLPVKEIADQFQCSVTSVYTKLHRALFKLKNQFNPAAYEGMYKILYPETGKPASMQ